MLRSLLNSSALALAACLCLANPGWAVVETGKIQDEVTSSPAPAAQAAKGKKEIKESSTISAVTLFPDRAKITRVAEINLPAGKSEVIVEGLPFNLIEESLRIEGESTSALTLGQIESELIYHAELVKDQEKELTDRLTQLNDEIRAGDDKVAALKMQLTFIESLGKAAAGESNREMQKGSVDPVTWKNAWTTIGAGAGEIMAQIQKLEITRREQFEKKTQLEGELMKIRTGSRQERQARIQLESAKGGPAKLFVEYQIGDASWWPQYDARLDVEKEKTLLVQYGIARNGTGEDWKDVELVLSTAQPSQGGEMPRLEPWIISLFEPQIYQEQDRMSNRQYLMAPQSPPAKAEKSADAAFELGAALPAQAPAPAPAEREVAQAHIGDFSAEYRIAGRVSAPADNEPHQFTIAEIPVASALRAMSVPKLHAAAYLVSEITNPGPGPLPAGGVSIYRDNAFIGKGSIEMTRPDEKFEIPFGIDDRIKIEYKAQKSERSEKGILNKEKRFERRWNIVVENYHTRAIRIIVQDQIPEPTDERIKVELLDDGDTPTGRDVEGRKGVLGWSYDYAPKEKRTIRFGYAVSYPTDKIVRDFE